jgi:Bax protein
MAEQHEHKRLYTDKRGKPAPKWIAITLVLVLFALFCFGITFYLASHPLGQAAGPAVEPEAASSIDPAAPDFESFSTVDERKLAFFQFLIPLVQEENQAILKKRERILKIKSELQSTGTVSRESRRYIEGLVEEYRFEHEELTLREKVDKLLLRVDKIPVSMALAQAATESAWGTSRFAKGGNNFFGQWCFRQGCGEIPLERSEDARHEVAVFASARDSVRSYFRNINTHRAYRRMREMRAALRETGKHIAGLELIQALGSYSERGQDYIKELEQIIAHNQLSLLDVPQSLAQEDS